MNILVIDQCSKDKVQLPDEDTYTKEDLADGGSTDEVRANADLTLRAVDLYTGRQQKFITRAAEKLESRAGDTVDRYFISAGFGLVHETDPLPPYDVTFTDSSAREIERRATDLGIERKLLNLVTGEYDIVFFALGSDYYGTFDLSVVLDAISPDTWVVCFNHESVTESYPNVLSLPARTEQAKEQKTIVVALKGKYLQNFAEHRAHDADVLDLDDLETYCTTPYGSQSDLQSYEDE